MFNFDEKFIKELKKQDHSTFNTFYIKTVDIFFRYINSNYYFDKSDIDDMISDFYVKLRDAIKKYDEKLSFSAYVWTILKNTIKDYLKKNVDIGFSDLDNVDSDFNFSDNLVDDFDILQILELNFKYEQIEKAIKKLDDISKDIIYLKFIEERDNNEIQEILGLSQENIRQKISRSIKYLKSLLDSDN